MVIKFFSFTNNDFLYFSRLAVVVGHTGCWHEHKSLRKHGINLISKTIDTFYHRCAGKIFNLKILCNLVVHQNTINLGVVGIYTSISQFLNDPHCDPLQERNYHLVSQIRGTARICSNIFSIEVHFSVILEQH